jgi:cellulose synthase/poly-beta-1,6-N-acetylglucosamine synthase-like glycosyltransferase
MTTILTAVTLTALTLIAWHFLVWPRVLARIARRLPAARPSAAPLPCVTLLMPAHNEAAFIVRKVENLVALDYPRDRLRIVIACDGCTDGTAGLARAALARSSLDAVVLDHAANRGKVAVLNEAIAAACTDVVALTDVSAMLPPDALRRAATWFADASLGAVGGTYSLEQPGSEGERAYWALQTAVKRGEAALGAPLGMHGAFWAFRRSAWTPLPADTINDDFIMPMRMFLRGWKLAYDSSIVLREAERSDPALDARRRRRIAAGNAQQLVRLAALLHPRHGWVAVAFASGKALRVAMPCVVGVALLGTVALAPASPFFALLAICEAAAVGLAVCGSALGPRAPKPLAVLHYAAAGTLASFMGVARYMLRGQAKPWRRAMSAAPARRMA